MKLISVQLTNFKNIKNSKIDFRGNLSGIYGPNGTGKTAVIEALEVIQLYYDVNKLGELSKQLKEKIEKLININSKEMSIEIELSNELNVYKLSLTVERDTENQGNLFVTKEEFSYKEKGVRKKYKLIAGLDNNINLLIPKFFLKKESLKSDFIEDILKEKNINLKSLILKFGELNSYFSLVYNYIENDINSGKLNEETLLFIKEWKEIKKSIISMSIITLQEQALYNLKVLIPMSTHLSEAHGTIPIVFKENSSNYYEENQVNIIEKVIEQIGEIFSVIIPNSKLIIKREDEQTKEDIKKIALNLYIEKSGNRIPIEKESTGIIKLVSLLSALIYYVSDEDAIVVIDELDVHIFEYLLAILLGKLSEYAKGQLIFTAHNLLPLEKLGKDSIIISTVTDDETSYTYFKKTSSSTNLRQTYLRSQSMWTETNIAPLMLNEFALDVYLGKLVK